MSTDRDRLAAALEHDPGHGSDFYCDRYELASVLDALLPVVDRIANERAAAELRAAAKAIRWDGLLQAADYAGYAAQLVDVRADALDPT